MKVDLKIKQTFNVKYIYANFGVRYYEDGELNGANPQSISNTVNQLNVFILDKDDEWHINQKINNQSLYCLIHEVRDKPYIEI